MADGTIAVNPTGATLLHTAQRTIGGNTNNEEYQAIAESALPTYTFSASAVSIATSGIHLIEVMASSAAVYVRVKSILITQAGAVSGVSNFGLQIWRLTSAGTTPVSTPSPVRKDLGDPVSSSTSMIRPAVGGTESEMIWAESIWLGTSGVPVANNRFEYPGQSPILTHKPIVIAQGATHGIAVKAPTGIASGSVDITVVIIETTWP